VGFVESAVAGDGRALGTLLLAFERAAGSDKPRTPSAPCPGDSGGSRSRVWPRLGLPSRAAAWLLPVSRNTNGSEAPLWDRRRAGDSPSCSTTKQGCQLAPLPPKHTKYPSGCASVTHSPRFSFLFHPSAPTHFEQGARQRRRLRPRAAAFPSRRHGRTACTAPRATNHTAERSHRAGSQRTRAPTWRKLAPPLWHHLKGRRW
jgi:hypothetical protein